MSKVVYPGTFDPVTLGHIDIIKKASKIFDGVTVAIAQDNNKNTAFSTEQRKKMVEIAVEEYKINAHVVVFSGLLVDFMEGINATTIVRGLRVISDFEYEFQMSCMNSRLNNNIETIFLPAKDDMHFISSRMIKSVAELGGDISEFIPSSIKEYVVSKLLKHK